MSGHMTTTDLAEHLQVPVKTLEDWRRHGGGPPFFKVGRHVRYRKAAVERWICERETTVTTPRRAIARAS